jgi:membrane-associated protein
MHFIAEVILPYLLLYKYVAIFMVTLLAALAVPIPPGTLLMAAAAFASQGYLSFPLVVLAGTAGNVAGDTIGYWLARKYGKRILYRLGFGRVIESGKYRNIERRLRKHPGFLIFVSRFEVFSNLAVNIICGLGEIPYRKYLAFEVIGEFLQVGLYCSIGYLVGDQWDAISGVVGHFLLLVLLVAAVLVIAFWKRIVAWLTRES